MKYLKWKARKLLANRWLVVPVIVIITSLLVIKSLFMRKKRTEAQLIGVGDEITYKNIYVKTGNCIGKVIERVDESLFLIERKGIAENTVVDVVDVLSVNRAYLSA